MSIRLEFMAVRAIARADVERGVWAADYEHWDMLTQYRYEDFRLQFIAFCVAALEAAQKERARQPRPKRQRRAPCRRC